MISSARLSGQQPVSVLFQLKNDAVFGRLPTYRLPACSRPNIQRILCHESSWRPSNLGHRSAFAA